MDEIDKIKSIKKALFFTLKFISVFLFILIIGSIRYAIDGEPFLLIMFISIWLFFILIEVLCFGVIYIIYKLVYSGKKSTWKKEYIRDLPKEYTPAIVSLIYDLKVDVYKDYTATILLLYTRGYISMKKSNDVYEFGLLIDEDNISNFKKHEQYVLNCINSKVKFDENDFKKLILKDAQELKLITDKKHSKLPKIALILLSCLLILAISYIINRFLFYILFVIIFTSLFTIILMKQPKMHIDTFYKRTNKGKLLANQMVSLKKFMHDYTLLKDREIDYIHILEEYIPYAISLDEANMIEEYIKNNDEYRDIIYNRKF